MRRLVAGIFALVLAAVFVMPLQAQETPEDAVEAAPAVVEDAVAADEGSMQEVAENAAAAADSMQADAVAAAEGSMQEVTEAAEEATEEAYQAVDDADDDNQWLWILGLAGAFIIVWFLLRRRKARREG